MLDDLPGVLGESGGGPAETRPPGLRLPRPALGACALVLGLLAFTGGVATYLDATGAVKIPAARQGASRAPAGAGPLSRGHQPRIGTIAPVHLERSGAVVAGPPSTGRNMDGDDVLDLFLGGGTSRALFENDGDGVFT